MPNLQTAFIHVDDDMAAKKGWGNMPLDELVGALNAKTHTRVTRVDRPLPAVLSADGVETPLFFELTV